MVVVSLFLFFSSGSSLCSPSNSQILLLLVFYFSGHQVVLLYGKALQGEAGVIRFRLINDKC